MQKVVTIWLGASPHKFTPATQLISKKCRNSGNPLITLRPILTCPRFEPLISGSRDERIIAQLTGSSSIRLPSSTNRQIHVTKSSTSFFCITNNHIETDHPFLGSFFFRPVFLQAWLPQQLYC